VIKVISLCVLLEKTERLTVRVLDGVNNMVGLCEIDLVIVANYLTLGLSF